MSDCLNFNLFAKIFYNYIDMDFAVSILRVITIQRKRVHTCAAGIEKWAVGISKMGAASHLDIPSEVFLVLWNIYVFSFDGLYPHFKWYTIPV